MSEHHLPGIKLGQSQDYVEHYDPQLLVAVPRALSRKADYPDFYGVDLWTAYEISWLSAGGKPQVAIGEFSVPAFSPNLIESKSFKYYLNSFNQTQLNSREELQQTLERDLSRVAGASVEVRLRTLDEYAQKRMQRSLPAALLDDLPLSEVQYQPSVDVLQLAQKTFTGVWYSHLLKSNCPVTGQPDWASVWIGWQGRSLEPESLLRYIISYRQHQDFHENCVERIYADLLSVGQPQDLWVYARYTRRGGLDINPFRSMRPMQIPTVVAARQ
jgi:7-cyano-7-deazaguanine reductase